MSVNSKNIETCTTCTTCKTSKTITTCKTDLTDFTFLFPLRIDSDERLANVKTVINYIYKYFETSFIVIEGGTTRKFNAEGLNAPFSYDFQEDKNAFFYKTKYINHLITIADTKYVAVWDTDVIGSPDQILDSVMVIRNGSNTMSIPYDGRVYTCGSTLSTFFRNHPQIDILEKLSPSLPLMYGYNSPGGAFLTYKIKYLKSGGENLSFKSWGPEDTERIKKQEILNLPVYRSPGPLFHLWHTRGKNSWYVSKEEEILNRGELIKTCSKILK